MPSPLNDTSSALSLLLSRRSGSAKAMSGPGPSDEEIMRILAAGVRVPDHGKLAPWRFILIEDEARTRLGDVLVTCVLEDDPRASSERLEQERGRFLRAPVIVAVVSRVREGIAIPEWEQILSAGAVCENILLASHAMGYVANWITEWYAYHPRVKDALGLTAGERVAGYIYIGTSTVALEDRPRPDIENLLTRF